MTSAIPKSNSKSQYLGLTLYQYLVNKWLMGNDPIQFPIQYMVSTIYMTSDISQSNSKSQYLRVPLYQYLQIKQHIGNDPIQFPIQYMDTPLSTSLNICMTSDIPKSNSKSQYLGLSFYQYLQIKWHIGNDPIQFPIQYIDTPVSTSLNFMHYQIYPNPIWNPNT